MTTIDVTKRTRLFGLLMFALFLATLAGALAGGVS